MATIFNSALCFSFLRKKVMNIVLPAINQNLDESVALEKLENHLHIEQSRFAVNTVF